jgi:hypothetical protein
MRINLKEHKNYLYNMEKYCCVSRIKLGQKKIIVFKVAIRYTYIKYI